MNKDNYYKQAAVYDFFIEPLLAPLRRIIASIVAQNTITRILDVGCGTGSTLKKMEKLNAHLFGIDLSAAMLKRAKSKFSRPVSLLRGDASRSPFQPHAFDVIISTLVLHEIEPCTRKRILTELTLLLQSGGRIYILEYSPPPINGWKSRIMRGFIHGIEFLAGRNHYRNFKNFSRQGGIPNLVKEIGLSIERQWKFARGNLTLYCLQPDK